MADSNLTQETIALMEGLLVPAASVARTIVLDPASRRFENDAEHSFLLASLGCALAVRMDEPLDVGKVGQYALVHDLVEVYAGDTSIWDAPEKHASKRGRESQALDVIRKRFGPSFAWVEDTISEYEKLADDESRFVYALDKIIPYIVMLAVDHQPYPRSREVFEEKIRIAREKVRKYPPLEKIFDGVYEAYAAQQNFFVR